MTYSVADTIDFFYDEIRRAYERGCSDEELRRLHAGLEDALERERVLSDLLDTRLPSLDDAELAIERANKLIEKYKRYRQT